jgi:hypothetical protein
MVNFEIPLRISALSALKSYFNAEGRRDTQRAAETKLILRDERLDVV